jgi:signal peptide peptidase SppA
VSDESLQLKVDVGRIRSMFPRVDDYFGYWAMEPTRMRAGVAHVKSLDLVAHVKASQPVAMGDRSYDLAPGNVAVIDVCGTLMKASNSFSSSSSTVELRRQIRDAANDPDVSAILLRIDSPGGTVSGTKDLADDVAEAAKRKNVVAYIEDLCASAAYWVASQCNSVYSNATALVGSIGAYMVVEDMSKMAEMEGVTVHVIGTGQYKGAGTPGSQVTDEHLAEWQRNVDALNEHFIEAVAAGRKMSVAAVRKIADGRVHVGAEAEALRLTDGIQSFDQTLAQLQAASPKSNPNSQNSQKSQSQRNPAMAEQTTNQAPAATSPAPAPAGPVAATIHDLRAACPDADDTFLVGQLTKGATVAQATSAWMTELSSRLKAETQARAEAEKNAQAANGRPGVVAPKSAGKGKGKGKGGKKADDEDEMEDEEDGGDDDGGDAEARFGRRIREQMKLTNCSRPKAVQIVAGKDPELHKAYLKATNRKRVHSRIDERFEAFEDE